MQTKLLHKMEALSGNTVQIIQALGYLKKEADRAEDAPLATIIDAALRSSITHLSTTSLHDNPANDNADNSYTIESFLYEFFTGSIKSQDGAIEYLVSSHDT